MKLKATWLWCFFALASCPAVAAELKDPDAALKLADTAMRTASEGKIREALELLRPYTVIPQSEMDVLISQVEMQIPIMSTRFGKSIGYELIRNDTVGESLIQPIYLLKHEKHPMVWRFIFYRNDKGWVLNSFKYVDDLGTVI
jgi:hypothetical protein